MQHDAKKKKLTLKEDQLQKLTETEADRRILAPYEAFTMYQLEK